MKLVTVGDTCPVCKGKPVEKSTVASNLFCPHCATMFCDICGGAIRLRLKDYPTCLTGGKCNKAVVNLSGKTKKAE